MLTLISESAAQVNLPLVTIDPGTIVFTLINTLIIFIRAGVHREAREG